MVEVTELLLDLKELEQIEALIKRARLKKLIQDEKIRLTNQIKVMEKSQFQKEERSCTFSKPKVPTVKITSYAWDQSDKFVKIYLSNLHGIQSLESSEISLVSDDQSHSLMITNLNGKNYHFVVPKLLHRVSNATFKVKTDMILIMLKKEVLKSWKYLTEQEKITKDEKEKVPPMDKDGDPSASIMNMMKKMYDEGDDDMKRTIAKAWTESREKMDK